MAGKSDAKSRRKRVEVCFAKLEEYVDQCERETIAAETARDRAIQELASRPIVDNEDGEPITAVGLGLILDWKQNHNAYCARIGRLMFWARADGSWGLHFDATYGGSIGSYRKLRTMNEVSVLIQLLGVMTDSQRRATE